MQFVRLPTSQNEDPILLAWVDEHGKTQWVIDSPETWEMDVMQYGENIWQVWREDNAVVVMATQWYSCSGTFQLRMSFVEPDVCVFMANECANHVNREDLV